jgi:phosphomannomutase
MAIKLSAFKSYDVRGVYPSEINEELAVAVAKAFAFFLQSDRVLVGRDDRVSSPKLHDALVNTFLDLGVDVYDLGVTNTPLFNYASAIKDFAGGIMITASHNPPEYNAFKIVKDGIQMSSPGELDDVKKIALNSGAISPLRPQKGKLISLEIIDEYVKELSDHFIDVKNLKVVVDYGNGMGSVNAKPVFKKLGLEIIPLYENIDCSFPNHHANPAEEKNIAELRKRVVDEKADLGIAFDGDADRSFIIDNNGDVIYPDIMMTLLVSHELKGRADKRVYFDLRSSKILAEVVKENRGLPEMVRVGNPFLKHKLKDQGGVFAGELSGHIMFQDHYCIDDGLYAALKVMKVLVESKKKLSEIVLPLKKYYQTPEINTKVKDADDTLRKVEESFPKGEHIEMDGVFVRFDDWWFSLRKSNTEPVVRLRVEANTKEKMNEMKEKIMLIVNS